MKKNKYPKQQVTATRNPDERAAFYRATDDQAPLPPRQLAAGLVQHPDTGLHQIWLSTNGLDITCLAVYRDPDRADVALEELKAFLRTVNVYDTDKCTEVFRKLQEAGDGEPHQLPDDVVRQIGRAILRRVVDGPR